MSDYIQIYFGSTSAAPKAVEWDRAMVIGDATPSTLTASKIYELAPDDWQTQLEDDGFEQGDTLYDSVSIFFTASPSPKRLFAYAYASGATQEYDDVPLEFVSDNLWQVPLRPPAGWKSGESEQVKYFGYGDDIGTGYWVNKADGSLGVGFTVKKDGAGNWDGQLEFTNGLSGESVDKPVPSNAKITVSYKAGSNSSLGEMIEDYRINMVTLALDNNSTISNYVDNIFGSELDDLMVMRSAISGKKCRFIYALPGNAGPEDTITGTTSKWKELKNLIGANEHFSAIKCIPSSTNDDAATGLMALVSISAPHKQIGFAEPFWGINEKEPKINLGKWKDAKIACIMKRTELTGDPFLITYGHTFGSGDVDRIAGSRCRDIMAQTLINNLWGLLAERDTRMSVDGIAKIKARIRSTFNTLISQKIVDGLVKIYVPIEEDLRNNTDAGKLARQQKTVPAVEIEYLYYPNVEKIIITSVDNAAT